MDLNDDALHELMRLHDKVKAGEELTPDEQAWLEAFIKVFVEALQPLIELLKEVAITIIKALQEFIDSLPEETKAQLLEATKADKVPVTTYSGSVAQYGIPSIQESMQQAVSNSERDWLRGMERN